MRRTFSAAAALAVLLLAGAGPALAAFDDLQKAFDSFYKTGLDPAGGIAIENLTLQKDAMTFVLKKGILIPMQPIEGEITGAMFVGEGTASLTPPTSMDAWYLKQRYGSGKFSETFTKLYMRFTDGTDKTFPKPAPGTTQAAVASQLEAITKAFEDRQRIANDWLETDRFDMDMDFLSSRTGGIRSMDLFYAQLQTEKWGWITFMLNYGDILEVVLGNDRTVGANRFYVPWAEFHKQADYRDGRYAATVASDSKELFDVTRNDMKVSIPTTKTVNIDAKLTLSSYVDSLSSLRFDLFNQFGQNSWRDQGRPITVESVTDAQGHSLPFLHKRNELLIRLPQPLPNGQPYVVEVKAKEDTIIQVTPESYVLYNTYPWFPQYGYVGGRYAFDFQIEIQRPLVPIGSGQIVREWEDKEKGMNGIELRMDDEVQFPSILFGRFIHKNQTYASPASKRDIALSVSAFPTMTFTVTDRAALERIGATTPQTFNLSVPPGKMQGILDETQAIIQFYESLYGPFPFAELNVAQMYPGSGFGQAPPALVQLDGFAFLSQAQVTEIFREGDLLHGFLSHEIGHQYWGHDIGWANDRDVWLSESFAEYSAGLYVQALMKEKRFQEMMNNWRQLARIGDPVAPIALANMIAGENANRYRVGLIYNKGPLVVHMIRMQMGNDNYTKAMTNVMTKYRHQNITTDMLARELGAVTGYSWDYFFDQWFRGVGIPEIHYKYSVTPQAGKYVFELTLRQKDVENFKKFLKLPVTWKGSSKEQLAEKDFMFSQQSQVYKLILPFEPKEVELDPSHMLLADFVQDK